MYNKKNNNLPESTRSAVKSMAKLRKEKCITSKEIADALGYKSGKTVYEIENFIHRTPEVYGHYIGVVRDMAKEDRSKKIKQVRNAGQHEQVTLDTLKRLRECAEIRRKSTVSRDRIAEEMDIVDRFISGGMVSHFEGERCLTEDRAKAYIAAVEKMCLTHQMAIETPAPVQPAVTVEESVGREWTVITPGLKVLKVSADSASAAALDVAKRIGSLLELTFIVHDGGTDFRRFTVRPISTFEVIGESAI